MPNLFLLAAALSAAFYGVFDSHRNVGLRRSASKTAAILWLAGFACLAGAPLLLVLALILSAFGDFFLSRDGDSMFLAGMAAFFSAHVAFIVLFLTLGAGGALLAGQPVTIAMLALFTGAIYALLWPGLGAFRLPVAVYSLAILGMGLSALDLPKQGAGLLILVGAGLFIVSDSVLAIEKFRLPQGSRLGVYASKFVWLTYWLAQATITWGVLGYP